MAPGELRYRVTVLLPALVSLLLTVCSAQEKVETFLTDPDSRNSLHAYDESYALIVGVDKYAHVQPRTSSVLAAKNLKDLLVSRFGFPEENIVMVLDNEARRDVIMEGIKKLQRRGPMDRLLVFLSGRGYSARDRAGNHYGFFVPVDGIVDTAAQALTTCISLDDLKQTLSHPSAKQTLLLLDFTVGGLRVEKQFNGPPPPRLGFVTLVTQPVTELLTAGSRLEPLAEDSATGMSTFSSKLIEALSSDLADENIDGVITGTELAVRTGVEVMRATQWKVHPQFGYMDSGQGDFLFVLPARTDTSTMTFDITPRDAAVFVDGKEVRWSGEKVRLPGVGYHTFQVQREGYQAIRRTCFANGRVSLKATVSLEKIPTRSLLVTVSVPDARVSVDGKFIGAPDHSLIVDPVEKGKHIVRADLDGYFPDSTMIDTEDLIQYAVNLRPTSTNGFVSVISSEAVHINLDGKEVGIQQVSRKEVLPGQHTVVLSGIGYDTYERKFVVHDSETVLIDRRLSRPTLTGAVLRSFVFPGWGQSYSGRHGIVYTALFLAMAAGTVEAQLDYSKANTDYRNKLAAYNAAPTPADAANLSPSVSSAKTKRNNFNYLRIGAAGLTGAFYIYDIINVWTHNPADLIREEEEDARKSGQSVSINAGFRGPDPAVTITIPF